MNSPFLTLSLGILNLVGSTLATPLTSAYFAFTGTREDELSDVEIIADIEEIAQSVSKCKHMQAQHFI